MDLLGLRCSLAPFLPFLPFLPVFTHGCWAVNLRAHRWSSPAVNRQLAPSGQLPSYFWYPICQKQRPTSDIFMAARSVAAVFFHPTSNSSNTSQPKKWFKIMNLDTPSRSRWRFPQEPRPVESGLASRPTERRPRTPERLEVDNLKACQVIHSAATHHVNPSRKRSPPLHTTPHHRSRWRSTSIQEQP